MPKDTELYDLLGVAPEATDIEYAPSLIGITWSFALGQVRADTSD
jgi:hypothetical protein